MKLDNVANFLFIFSVSLLILCSSKSFLLFDLFDLRNFFTIFFLFFSFFLFLFTNFRFYKNNLSIYKIFKLKKSDILFYILISAIILSGLYHKNYNSILFGIFFLVVLIILNGCTLSILNKIVNFICIILGITCLLSLIGIFMFYVGDIPHNAFLIRGIDTLQANMNYLKFLHYLGGAADYSVFGNNYYPRFSGQIDQPSAIPALILLPAAISIYLNKKLHFFPGVMILSTLFSLGGSVLFSILSALIFFSIFFLYKKKLTWFNSPPLFLLYFIYLFFVLFFLFIVLFPELNLALVNDFNYQNRYLRLESGKARIIIIIDSAINFSENFLFGTNLSFVGFGQIFISYGNNFGIISVICISIIIFKIMRNLVQDLNNTRNNLWCILSIGIIFSLFFQFILYNDYAMSRLWGLIFIYILHKISLLNSNLKKFRNNI